MAANVPASILLCDVEAQPNILDEIIEQQNQNILLKQKIDFCPVSKNTSDFTLGGGINDRSWCI